MLLVPDTLSSVKPNREVASLGPLWAETLEEDRYFGVPFVSSTILPSVLVVVEEESGDPGSSLVSVNATSTA